MKYGNVNYRENGLFAIQGDEYGILGKFIAWTIAEMLEKKPSEFSDFLKRFEPMGDGYYIYDTAAAYRSFYAIPDEPDSQSIDKWTVSVDRNQPVSVIGISGDELRRLFREVIEHMMPEHPELRSAYPS